MAIDLTGDHVFDISINPSASQDIAVRNTNAPIAKLDVYFLIDTTGSMDVAMANIQSQLISVINKLDTIILPGLDVAYGLGEYRDFPNTVAEVLRCQNLGQCGFCFRHILAVTTDKNAVRGGLRQLVARGGGDVPEGQLYALDRIGFNTSPQGGGPNWRNASHRVVAWVGDAPAHDPIFKGTTGLWPNHQINHDVTTGSVITLMKNQKISVSGMSVSGNGLNDPSTPSPLGGTPIV